MKFNISLGKRLLMLLFAFIIGYFVVALISTFVIYKWGMHSTPAMRILAVLQDVLMFISPAIITAVVCTRRPATLLAIDKPVNWRMLILGVCVMICAIPALNYVIWLNQNLPLPEGLETALRSMEDSAVGMVEALQGPHDIPNLILSVLIVGVFAGLSEELLFRGAFQRIMSTGGLNAHAAIWIAAVVFSLMHMQFYGFVPRLLLGAFFGYSLLWGGSIWAPIILHALNNSVYVISQYFSSGESTLDTFGAGSDYAYVIISVAMTAFGIVLMRRAAPRKIR
ncbi:MAG: CPBP family intramembrane metalloprotease [Clostridium sp.]|nr:CPBP family intramembrane metalloprotease [Clostridium sp.]